MSDFTRMHTLRLSYIRRWMLRTIYNEVRANEGLPCSMAIGPANLSAAFVSLNGVWGWVAGASWIEMDRETEREG